ncbi:MAG: PKD domain-containing protein [Lewinellaceae bacterium]|nr:PKD domain-containing protein [Lewinellaceae bacterium]
MLKLVPALHPVPLPVRLAPLAGLFLLFLASHAHLSAQCERVGWVANTTTGCGARIIDLDNGQLIRAVVGAEDLLAGETIRFSAAHASLPPGCFADGLPSVALTCVSDTLPCIAHFGYAFSPQNAFRINFEADIYDPAVQFCSWNFGDGSLGAGHSVQHTFPHEGYFTVYLTVTDAHGCSAQTSQDVFVSQQNPNWCGYDAVVTAVGTKLYGKLGPVVADPGTVKSIKWFDNKTNTILAETTEFTATLPGEGTYFICAQYEIENPDGQTFCATTRCQVVTVAAPSCVNAAMVNNSAICASFFAPVCGCNGVTYINECTAMAAGVTKWWAGECGAPAPGTCGADLDVEIVSGSPAQGYTVRFRNLSSGSYTNVQLDFGDGSPLWTGGPADTVVEYYYAGGGVYRTNLTVWKNNNCVSSVDKIVVTDTYSLFADQTPPMTDYVLPGDANGDKRANVYDLLNLGLGFAETGSPRPFATTAWLPQFAPDWGLATTVGVNFKHIDCDGNGVVNEFDRNAIEQNYSAIDTGTTVYGGDAPRVWARFAVDSIVIDPGNPMPQQISADIMVGSPSKPALGLYGLAFALCYPEYMNHDPEVLYSTNSFFGFPTDILLLPKDIHSRRQFDLGFARKHGQPVSGFGSIAKINFSTNFIIIIDVIERAGGAKIPFTLPVHGLRAIDPAGNPIELEGIVKDTLWLHIKETTGTSSDATNLQVLLYPNPASEEAWLAVGSNTLEQVVVFDAVGRLVEVHQPTGVHTTRIDTRLWGKGLFTLRIQTKEGVAEKRLAVH